MKTVWIGLTALALLSPMFAPGPVKKAAARIAVAAPVRLTAEGDNLKPFVAVRPRGGAYVAWARKNGEKSTIVLGRAKDGAHLDSEARVSLIGMHIDLGAENGPNVAVDAGGAVYVVWVA